MSKLKILNLIKKTKLYLDIIYHKLKQKINRTKHNLSLNISFYLSLGGFESKPQSSVFNQSFLFSWQSEPKSKASSHLKKKKKLRKIP